MLPLTASEVLQVWERGQGLHPVDRALVLLAAALPGTPWEQLARLPIGRRDALLLSLRARTFGKRLTSYAECPRCSEKLEFEESIENIATGNEVFGPSTGAAFSADSLVLTGEPKSLEVDGYSVQYHLPDSFDLAAIASAREPEAARQLLLDRCVVGIARSGAPASLESQNSIAARDLPATIVALLSEKLEQVDPDADISFELTCPACGHRWQVAFDIVTFFWAEINSLAKRLLQEVHTLARAYGWREADILGMSAARRQAYIDMVLQ